MVITTPYLLLGGVLLLQHAIALPRKPTVALPTVVEIPPVHNSDLMPYPIFLPETPIVILSDLHTSHNVYCVGDISLDHLEVVGSGYAIQGDQGPGSPRFVECGADGKPLAPVDRDSLWGSYPDYFDRDTFKVTGPDILPTIDVLLPDVKGRLGKRDDNQDPKKPLDFPDVFEDFEDPIFPLPDTTDVPGTIDLVPRNFNLTRPKPDNTNYGGTYGSDPNPPPLDDQTPTVLDSLKLLDNMVDVLTQNQVLDEKWNNVKVFPRCAYWDY